MTRYVEGQRWVSEAEPELGLGRVTGAEGGRVTLEFPASGERRQYAAEIAPLRRVRFRAGESVSGRDGAAFVVADVRESGGLLVYEGAGGRRLVEVELSDRLGFGSPEARLLHGQADPGREFDLRREALELEHRRRHSPVRGVVGGRMDLIPHQLYIAREVTGRWLPRVLLADEVGLGKTIEACLIVHRLLATGRASRVLVVVPEPLVHQWFVELLRRFNLWFHLFDEERCDAVEAAQPEVNPFLDDQLVLCGLPLLLEPRRAAQAAEAAWDLLVVDEAHHLRWSATGAGPEYRAVELLARRTEGLLLLTATPEQLGFESHFARLRLLDPSRYHDLEAFRGEAAGYGAAAAVAHRLLDAAPLAAEDVARVREILGGSGGEGEDRLSRALGGEAEARARVVEELLDRHGPGRVMFRNTRAAMKGFPRRRPLPVELAPGPDPERLLERLADELARDLGSVIDAGDAEVGYARDPRVLWLVGLLRETRVGKVLLICRRKSKVLALEAAIREHLSIPVALFHEDLELVQRDRHAAWFADPEGARILLASEIGSEGRNFQFAHDLVLFDLPLDPELVEQRIGRLDRIGQTQDIRIHLPYVKNSPQEVLFRWFHDGLDSFGHNLHAGRELLDALGGEVRDLAMDFHETHATRREELEALVARSRAARCELERRLEAGRDRLLELNSFRAGPAGEIVKAVAALDRDESLERFLLRVWDQFGVPVEDLGPRRYRIAGDGVYADSFPGLPAEGMVATFDRAEALGREDVAFLTWDHPMVTGALDLLVGGPRGSTACVAWPTAPQPGLWLEAVHVLECVAPARLHADRYLPPTPVRILIDAQGREVAASLAAAFARARPVDAPLPELLDAARVRELLSSLVAAAGRMAGMRATPVRDEAAARLEKQLGGEIERLRSLSQVNPNVRADEIAGAESELAALREALRGARVRLDSLRVVVLGEW